MSELLEAYAGMNRVDADGRRYEIRTRQVIIETGLTANTAELSAPWLGDESGAVAIVYDDHTYEAAGTIVESSFRERGRPFVPIRLTAPAQRQHVVCDDATLDRIGAALSDAGVVGAVAVGSGTINDLVKMGSHRLGVPYVSIPTAPSNNGYTSAIAAILSDGVKTTQPCEPAVAVFADPEVLRHAPYRMIASGIGDLYSKPVSNADWRLSYRLNDSFYSPVVMEIVDAGNALLDGVAAQLPRRDPDAVARLTEAIMLSGMGMQAAGSSGPASGGEHLVSHYLDMTADRDGEPHDLHGCQVAVGTVATATLYARLAEASAQDVDLESCLSRLPPWEAYRRRLLDRFGPLADAVVAHAEAGYPSPDELRARLERLLADWSEIMAFVGETLRRPDDLAGELASADCPIHFEQVGVSSERALRSLRHCKDIRNRYTVLHLLWELGWLDAWAAALIQSQYHAPPPS